MGTNPGPTSCSACETTWENYLSVPNILAVKWCYYLCLPHRVLGRTMLVNICKVLRTTPGLYYGPNKSWLEQCLEGEPHEN